MGRRELYVDGSPVTVLRGWVASREEADRVGYVVCQLVGVLGLAVFKLGVASGPEAP
jgi:hypothetical protein